MSDAKHEALRRFVPLDKCWTLRLGVLDMLNGKSDQIAHEIASWANLRGQKSISKDIRALLACARNWTDQSMPVQVADCRTLYCYLKYASWKADDQRMFMLSDPLLFRSPNADPKVLTWKQQKLLTLEGGSSQWASAAILSGSEARLLRPPPPLKLTYHAQIVWKATQ